jgi:hypothetical protein
MEKVKPTGLLRYGLMTTLLVLAMQELANFVGVGGLESQIGFTIIKIQLYCFLFLFLQWNDLQIDVEKLRTALEAVILEIMKQRNEKKD